MREPCIAAVEAALGRPLQAGESRGIEDRIMLQMRLGARNDPDLWRAMSGTQRLQEAGKRAARAMISDVAKQKQRIGLMVPVFDRIERQLDAAGDKPTDRLKALSRLLAFDPGSRDGAPASLESWAAAQEKMALGSMRKMLLATKPKVMGLFEDKAGIRDLTREIYGEHTGNADAAEGARAWKKWADEARDRYNAAGGDIGKLGEHYFPQHHDPYRVGDAGLAQWTRDLMPHLDRDKYLESDGQRMNDGRVQEFLSHAFDTIINDGKATYRDMQVQPDMLNKDMFARNQFGYGLYADRNAQHRQIFFKDADSFLRYSEAYSGRSVYSTMEGHVRRMARDTAVLERMGPYADQAFGYFNEREARDARGANSDQARSIDKAETFNQDLYNEVTGRTRDQTTRVSEAMQGFRNVLTGLRLEKVVITAMGDEAGMYATSLANKIPYSQVLLREARALTNTGGDRAKLEGAGLGLQSMLGSLNRFGGELYGGGWTGRFANFMMRISGAERMWDTRKQAIGAELMYHAGQLSRTVEHVKDLTEAQHGVIARKGFTEAQWQTLRASELDSDGRVTPGTIWATPDEKLQDRGDSNTLKRDAATQLMSHVLEEAGMGVMETGARQRTQMAQATGGFTRTGTGRSALLFKTFSTSMMLKHWTRAASLGTLGSKAGYLSALALYGTVIAAAGNTIRSLLSGQQPPDYSKWQSWGGAVLRGGGLGYFGDFLYDAENSNDNTLLESLAGPAATGLSDVWNVTGAAAFKAARGERTDEAAHLIRLARDNTPLTQLWYTSAAFDHLLWNNIQEAANPGYLERMQDRQAKYGRQYWWAPSQGLPSAGPDVGRIVGKGTQ